MLSLVNDWPLEATLLIVAILVYALYVYQTSTFDYWLVRGVPYRKPIPLLGNFADVLLFLKSQPEGVYEMYNWFKNEPYFGVFQIRSPALVIRDPELIKSICIKDFQIFCNRGIPVNNNNPLTGNLFNLEGKPWKLMRSKLTPVFSSGKLKNMFYLLNECSKNLVCQIERRLASSHGQDPSAIINTHDLAMDFTVDVIGSCAFGIQISALTEDSDFRRIARKFSNSSYKDAFWRMLRSAPPKLYKLLNIQMVDSSVTKFFLNAVSQMIKERESKHIKRHDFMDLLIDLKRKTDELNINVGAEALKNENTISEEIVMTEDIIAAQAFVFFVAGYDTSANAIAFCLYELALNPEIQQKVRCDIINTLKKSDGKLTYDAIQDMKYLDLVILESLRKYPAAASISRCCEQPYKLPGSDVTLPKGMRVIIPVYGIHHDPNYYPDPFSFRPERFQDDKRQTLQTCTYLSFGEGPRSCIGMRFAQLQTKVGIISFLRTFKIETCEKTDIPIKFSKRSFIISTENGIWLKVLKLSE
ncbi:PREDICTED: probable cytochrome P450 6a13 [Ceratosolen solmsi marchali]|uniref:Probable cytochrome P450 6a13 n=1 Tax=Ceratosolen solmsi marchali TaxID=326594 RepID=A0AAJ6YNT8_9HYME|nr:PREDICTED: probable cytochrome P450 6a13 [Ceratosolen solmsi marchali]